jgi:hypothetical protein
MNNIGTIIRDGHRIIVFGIILCISFYMLKYSGALYFGKVAIQSKQRRAEEE